MGVSTLIRIRSYITHLCVNSSHIIVAPKRGTVGRVCEISAQVLRFEAFRCSRQSMK